MPDEKIKSKKDSKGGPFAFFQKMAIFAIFEIWTGI